MTRSLLLTFDETHLLPACNPLRRNSRLRSRQPVNLSLICPRSLLSRPTRHSSSLLDRLMRRAWSTSSSKDDTRPSLPRPFLACLASDLRSLYPRCEPSQPAFLDIYFPAMTAPSSVPVRHLRTSTLCCLSSPPSFVPDPMNVVFLSLRSLLAYPYQLLSMLPHPPSPPLPSPVISGS